MAELEDIKELLACKDILYHVVYLGVGVAGVVYYSSMGVYHIFINETLSREAKIKVLIHEIKHIKSDMPLLPYIIGLNLQHMHIEKEADKFANSLILKASAFK